MGERTRTWMAASAAERRTDSCSVEGLVLDIAKLSITGTLLTTPLSIAPPPLLHFTQAAGSVLSSDSTVTGVPFGFTRTGTSTIADLGLSINGGAATSLSTLATAAGISYSLVAGSLVGVPPNSTITLGVNANGSLPGLGGGALALNPASTLTIIFNEQVLDGDPNITPRIATTALHLDLFIPGVDLNLLNLAGGPFATENLVGGTDVILGFSQAQLVPEPATFSGGLAVTGLVTSFWLLRHRRSGCKA